MGISDIKQILNKHFYYSFQANIIINIFLFFSGLIILLPQMDFKNNLLIAEICTSTYVLLILSHNIYWLISRYKVPKVSSSCKGILVAVTANEYKYFKDIDWNYIRNINEILKDSFDSTAKIQLIDYHQAKRIKELFVNENYKKLGKIVRYSRNICVIFMDMTCDGDLSNKKFMQLESKRCYVIHNAIPKPVSNKFGYELYQIIRNEIFSKEEIEENQFKAKAAEMAIIAEYIIGITTFLCDKFEESDKILYKVVNNISAIRHNSKPIDYIKSVIRERLFEVNELILNKHYENFVNNYDMTYLKDLYKELNHINSFYPNSDKYFIGMAYYTFWAERNINKCKYFNSQCKELYPRSTDVAINEAFFDAYEGKIPSAYKKYKKLFKRTVHTNIVLTEEFITKVLEQEDRPGLLFALALINLYYKNDKDSSRNYFNSLKEKDICFNKTNQAVISLFEDELAA